MDVLPPNSVAVVLGTRPEIIKLAHIIKLLGPAARVVHTGQHYDAGLSDVFFDAFDLRHPTEYLGIGGKTRGEQIGLAVTALDETFAKDRPDAVVVQGDTNSVLAAALAANAREIPLTHVEAGLRSFDRRMPEEHNRVVADHLADLCLTPTEVSMANLAAEGITGDRVVATGNTIVEAVRTLLPDAPTRLSLMERYGVQQAGFILSTFHRPENVDDPKTFASIMEALGAITAPVILPLHPRSRAQMLRSGLTPPTTVQVIEPIPYPDFLGLLAECAIAIGDSGGLQEEVSIVKRPMLVVRRSTERPEVMGTFAELVPPTSELAETANRWMDDIDETHREISELDTPFGDGHASERSVSAIVRMIQRQS
jgi:UDP-N-acetylglucosamine 2-epimerase (non-hydrolysing)